MILLWGACATALLGLLIWRGVLKLIEQHATAAKESRPEAPPIYSEGEPRQAWRCIPGAGSISSLQKVDECLPLHAPPLGASDGSMPPRSLRVRVAHVGLNFADIFAVTGLYSATPKGPFIPGLELAGTVEGEACQTTAVRRSARRHGSSPDCFPPGTEVMAVTRFGAYASVVHVDARCARPLPDGWSTAEGAAFCCQGLTAFYGLKQLGGLVADGGQTVLVHSAAGGVGIYATRITEAMGGKVIGTVGSERKAAWLVEHLGLRREQIIVRTSPEEFGEQLDAALASVGSSGIDISMDSLLGGFFGPAFERTNPMGRIVVFGAGSMTTAGDKPNWLQLAWHWLKRPTLDPLDMIPQNRSVMAFNLIWLWEHLDVCSDLLDELLALNLPPPIVGHRFPFEEAPSALREFQKGGTTGKLVLEL